MRFFRQKAAKTLLSSMTLFLFCRICAKRSPSNNAASSSSPGTGPEAYHRCTKCLMDIGPTDLVMKAKQSLFHVDCFRCFKCHSLLTKGDLFGMADDRDDVVFCQLHFCEETQSPDDYSQPFPAYSNPYVPECPKGEDFQQGYHPMMPPFGGYRAGDDAVHEGWYGNESQGQPGMPMDDQYGFPDQGEVVKKKRGRKKRRITPLEDEEFAGQMSGMFPMSADEMGMAHSHGKSKRARTSFKHHQLRIMRSHFQINQNPDSRELKMLSQKTGLDKKVLQVWFQNSRAKWRRSQSGSSDAGGGGNPPAPAPGGGNVMGTAPGVGESIEDHYKQL